MKITQRVPTCQYGYIEFEQEYDSVEDGMADHKRITKLYEDQGSLTHREWVAIRNGMLATGEFDPNLSDKLSAAQRYWVNETKLAMRAHTPEEPVIN